MANETLYTALVDLKRYLVYTDEPSVDDAQLMRAVNRAQARLAREMYATNEGAFAYNYNFDIDSSASYVLPPRIRKIQYVEYQGASGEGWYTVKPANIRDRDGYSSETDLLTTGTIRIFYTRYLPDLAYGTVAGLSATTLTLPATAAYGTISRIDDYYNGAWVEIVSGTGSWAERRITDYVGSTRVATVAAWDTNPDTSSIFNIKCELPVDFIYSGLISGAASWLTRDKEARQDFDEDIDQIKRFSSIEGQTVSSLKPYEVDYSPNKHWYVRGNRIYLFAS